MSEYEHYQQPLSGTELFLHQQRQIEAMQAQINAQNELEDHLAWMQESNRGIQAIEAQIRAMEAQASFEQPEQTQQPYIDVQHRTIDETKRSPFGGFTRWLGGGK